MYLVPRPKRKRDSGPSTTFTPAAHPSQVHLTKVYLSFIEAIRAEEAWSIAPDSSEAAFSSDDTNTPINREEMGTEMILMALEHACFDIDDLMALRGTCRALKTRVDGCFPHHIRVGHPLRMCADRVNGGVESPLRVRIAYNKSVPTLPPLLVTSPLSETMVKVISAVHVIDLMGRWDGTWIPIPLTRGCGYDTDTLLNVVRHMTRTLVRVRPDTSHNGPYRIPRPLEPCTYIGFIRLAPPAFKVNGIPVTQYVEIPKSADRVFLAFTYDGVAPLRECRPPLWNLPPAADEVLLLFTELKHMIPVHGMPSAYVSRILRHILPHLLRGISYTFIDIGFIHPHFIGASSALTKKTYSDYVDILKCRLVNILAGELHAPWSPEPYPTKDMILDIAHRLHIQTRWDTWEGEGDDMDLELPGPFDTPVRCESFSSDSSVCSDS